MNTKINPRDGPFATRLALKLVKWNFGEVVEVGPPPFAARRRSAPLPLPPAHTHAHARRARTWPRRCSSAGR